MNFVKVVLNNFSFIGQLASGHTWLDVIAI